MTQVSLAPRPNGADSLRSAAAEAPGEAAEDPDSPGPHSPPDPRAVDPWAEPMAGLLGTALALLSLAVPLLAVVGEGRIDATRPAYALERIELESSDPRPNALKRVHNRATTGGTARP